MTNPNSLRLVEQCVHKGLIYLAETLQYPWPTNGELAENNIALHLARSFAEKGFQVWAEVPLDKENRRLDFLARNYAESIAVALEFKRSIDTPQGNYEDLKRLVAIHKNGLSNDMLDFGEQSGHRIYGIVAFLFENEFAVWWWDPKGCKQEYMPDGKSADLYTKIGMALAATKVRYVVPLCEHFRSPKYRFSRAAYALYDEASIDKLKEALGGPSDA